MPSFPKMRSLSTSVLKGAAWVLAVIAGLSFWVGGRALHEFAGVDRMVGEMAGIFLAVVFAGLSFVLKSSADKVEDPDDGEPVTLAISSANGNEESRRDV